MPFSPVCSLNREKSAPTASVPDVSVMGIFRSQRHSRIRSRVVGVGRLQSVRAVLIRFGVEDKAPAIPMEQIQHLH